MEVSEAAQSRLVGGMEKLGGPRSTPGGIPHGRGLTEKRGVLDPTGLPHPRSLVQERKNLVQSCYTWQGKSVRVLSVCIAGAGVGWKSRCSPVGYVHRPNQLPQLTWCSVKRRDPRNAWGAEGCEFSGWGPRASLLECGVRLPCNPQKDSMFSIINPHQKAHSEIALL